MTHPADMDWFLNHSPCPLDQLESRGMCMITGSADSGGVCVCVCVFVFLCASVYALTHSVVTHWPWRGQTHTASLDNSTNPELPTVKPSILWPADRGIFNSSTICITFIQSDVTAYHPSINEQSCRELAKTIRQRAVPATPQHLKSCKALVVK